MKIEKVAALYRGTEQYFQCPICTGDLKLVENRSFRCGQGHCFDLSGKGYINFVPNQNQRIEKYDAALFESRRRIFQRGFYDRVHSALADQIGAYAKEQEIRSVLDVGCGEGSYAERLAEEKGLSGAMVFGMDLVKDAITIACRSSQKVRWLVGNLMNIPMKNDSVDVLLNILTPANYEEFLRVLKSGGLLLKVIPGCDYLKEIRSAAGGQLSREAYSNEQVCQCFREHVTLLEQRRLFDQLPVTPEEFGWFLEMTPMTFHVDLEELKKNMEGNAEKITIHLELLIGRKDG